MCVRSVLWFRSGLEKRLLIVKPFPWEQVVCVWTRPQKHTCALASSLSCTHRSLLLSASAFYSDTSPGIQSSIVLSVANWPAPSSPASNLTHYPQNNHAHPLQSAVSLLSDPPFLSICRLHYSPLIVKSFCSISTHPFYKHTLLIFLFFMYSLQISHHNVLFGSAVFLKTSHSFDLWSFGINFLQSYI